MNKEFIPYEQALALKKLGFDEPCLASYETAFGKGIDFELGYIIDGPKNYVLTPLYQQAFRFFREKYKLDSWIEETNYGINNVNKQYAFQLPTLTSYLQRINFYDTYEEAEFACLIKLIEICRK